MSIKLISVYELLDKIFHIPSYQRGYRWDERQVLDLLEDIYEFQRKGQKLEGEFYCLQPLVVKKGEEKEEYELIDGQQRLTTIFLLLSYLEAARKILFNNDTKKYIINYEIRKSSESFLNSISKFQEENNENIDYYYMSKAYLTIKNWFETKNPVNNDYPNKGDFLNTLLKSDIREEHKDYANNVRFIWYEVEDDNQEPEEIFTRLNIGKIPLTNAELIKALFFIHENEEDKKKHQFKKAYEWEYMEEILQKDDFWYFLNKQENVTPTRIDFIFTLIADKYKNRTNIKVDKSIDKYYAFYIFNELINNQKIDIKNVTGNGSSEDKARKVLWDEIKTYFRIFEEWFNDNRYYHLIGFLTHVGAKTENIVELSLKNDKSNFLLELKKLVSERLDQDLFQRDNNSQIVIKKEELNELKYQEVYQLIRNLLFLFNVILTMKSEYTRFPFDKFIREKWSLEHIHAQNSEEIKRDEDKKALLEAQKKYFERDQNTKMIDRINKILQNDSYKDQTTFKTIQDEIFKIFTGEEINSGNLHAIDNLALLSGSDNSCLNNNIFPIKREMIIELDKNGKFIPIGTKNVFLKYFSKNSRQNVIWDNEDRKDYIDAIQRTLDDFFKGVEM
jgi:uncharacterized protein with ParB-like and HNH nuclease domain